MSESFRLVMGYDGSSFADDALEDLQRAGLPKGTEAVVVTIADVYQPPAGEGSDRRVPDFVADAVKKARARAAQAVEKAREIAARAEKKLRGDFPQWKVSAEAFDDSPAWGLIKKAEEWNADLVVVGSQGRSALGGLILGSVSQRVVSNARCSVRVARRRAGRVADGVRILVGVDGSPDADVAVRTVAARKWPAGSEIRVVTVMDPDMPVPPGADWFDPSVAERMASEMKHEHAWARQANAAAAEKLRGTGATVTCRVDAGDAKRILLEEAERWGADCIFVGARGLRGIERFLLGSVSTAVANHARCSVEVARVK
ncbi:MAG: universal stress protein [Candidatus Acidiferrales bacterium]